MQANLLQTYKLEQNELLDTLSYFISNQWLPYYYTWTIKFSISHQKKKKFWVAKMYKINLV